MEYSPEKQPTSIRLSQEAKMLVEELSKTFGISLTAVYEQAIRRWARQEGITISADTEAKFRTSETTFSSGETNEEVVNFPHKPSQRDFMRQLVKRLGADEERVVQEYAEAEKRGEVERRKNTYKFTPEQYARALWRDGVKKGWIDKG